MNGALKWADILIMSQQQGHARVLLPQISEGVCDNLSVSKCGLIRGTHSMDAATPNGSASGFSKSCLMLRIVTAGS